MVILNGNDETVNYIKGKDKLWLKEVFYKKQFMGINLMVNKNIVDTYISEHYAKRVLLYLFNTSKENIIIEELNEELDVF